MHSDHISSDPYFWWGVFFSLISDGEGGWLFHPISLCENNNKGKLIAFFCKIVKYSRISEFTGDQRAWSPLDPWLWKWFSKRWAHPTPPPSELRITWTYHQWGNILFRIKSTGGLNGCTIDSSCLWHPKERKCFAKFYG